MALCLHVMFSSVFLLSFFISFRIYYFQTRRQHQQGDPWPGSSVVILLLVWGMKDNTESFISGGSAGAGETYDDMWLMDPQ